MALLGGQSWKLSVPNAGIVSIEAVIFGTNSGMVKGLLSGEQGRGFVQEGFVFWIGLGFMDSHWTWPHRDNL